MRTTSNGVPRSKADAQAILTGEPMTLGYRPSLPVTMFWTRQGHFAPYSLWTRVEEMLTHPRVYQPYSYYKAGISHAVFAVKGPDPKVCQFYEDDIKRFWTRSLDQVQHSYDFGWGGLEVCYSKDRSLMMFEGIYDFHPMDCWALTVKNKYAGVSVQNVDGQSDKGKRKLWGPRHWPAKGFWFVHNRRFNRWYGRSQLYGAYRPYLRLADRDGAEEVLDGGFYRFAYRGPFMRYPPHAFRKSDGSDDVDYDAAREKSREFTEQAKAGVSVALPNTKDESGDYHWSIDWPQSTMTGLDNLIKYVEYLDNEISWGIGVPPELLEASDTGSGWSGRKIPMIGYFMGQLKNARAVVWAYRRQVGDPLAMWNFGACPSDYEIEVSLKVPDEITGADQQALGMGGGESQQGGPAPVALSLQNPSGSRVRLSRQDLQMARVYFNSARDDGKNLSLATDVQKAARMTVPPTEAQRESGNYKKGKVTVQGLPITIEIAKGQTRNGKSKDGKEWSVKMAHHYGYIRKTKSGADGDHVDVFIGPDPESEIVFVIDQTKADGSFDEHKCMIGFTNEEDAKEGYLDCYSKGWKLGKVTPMTMRDFKAWVEDGDSSKPVAKD